MSLAQEMFWIAVKESLKDELEEIEIDAKNELYETRFSKTFNSKQIEYLESQGFEVREVGRSYSCCDEYDTIVSWSEPK